MTGSSNAGAAGGTFNLAVLRGTFGPSPGAGDLLAVPFGGVRTGVSLSLDAGVSLEAPAVYIHGPGEADEGIRGSAWPAVLRNKRLCPLQPCRLREREDRQAHGRDGCAGGASPLPVSAVRGDGVVAKGI